MTKFKAGDVIATNVPPRPPAKQQTFLVCKVVNNLQIKYAQYDLYCYNTGKRATIACENVDRMCKLIKKASKMDLLLYN